MSYHALNTVKVASTYGRVFSAKHENPLYNGTIGYVGDYLPGELEVRAFHLADEESIRTQLPQIVADPEVVYDNWTRAKNAIGFYRTTPEAAFTVMPLIPTDEIEVSADSIDKADELEVGSIVKQKVGGGLIKADSAPSKEEAFAYFKVVGIRNGLGFQIAFNAQGSVPQHKVYCLELVLAK